MKFNWKKINLIFWIFILVANGTLNIWLVISAFQTNSGLTAGFGMLTLMYFIAPLGIATSIVFISLIKSKYVSANHKLLSLGFIILLYILSFIALIT